MLNDKLPIDIIYIKQLPNKPIVRDDFISPYLIRDCRYVVAKPMAKIINLLLETSPKIWKNVRIVSEFKGGDRSIQVISDQ